MTPHALVDWFNTVVLPASPLLTLLAEVVHLPQEEADCAKAPLTGSWTAKRAKFDAVYFPMPIGEVTAAACAAAFKGKDLSDPHVKAALAQCGNWAKAADSTPAYDKNNAGFCDEFFPGPVENWFCRRHLDEALGAGFTLQYQSGETDGQKRGVHGCTFTFTGHLQRVLISSANGKVAIALDSADEIALARDRLLSDPKAPAATAVAPGSLLFLRHLHALAIGQPVAPPKVDFAEFDAATGALSLEQLRRVWQRRMAVAVYFDVFVAPGLSLPRLDTLSAADLYGLLAPIVRRRLLPPSPPAAVPAQVAKAVADDLPAEKFTTAGELFKGTVPWSIPEDPQYLHAWPQVLNETGQWNNAQALRHGLVLVPKVGPYGTMELMALGGYFPAGVWDTNPLRTMTEALAAVLFFQASGPSPADAEGGAVAVPAGHGLGARAILTWLFEQTAVVGEKVGPTAAANARGKACTPYEARALPTIDELLVGAHTCDVEQWQSIAQAALRALNIPSYRVRADTMSFDSFLVAGTQVLAPGDIPVPVVPTALVQMAGPKRWGASGPGPLLAIPGVSRVAIGAVGHVWGAAWVRDPLLATFDASGLVACSLSLQAGMSAPQFATLVKQAPMAATFGPFFVEALFGFLATAHQRFPGLAAPYQTATVRQAVALVTGEWAKSRPPAGSSLPVRVSWAMRFAQLRYTAGNHAHLLPPDFPLDFAGISTAAWSGGATLDLESLPWTAGKAPWAYALDAQGTAAAKKWQSGQEVALAKCPLPAIDADDIKKQQFAACYAAVQSQIGFFDSTRATDVVPTTLAYLGLTAAEAFADAVSTP